MDALSWVLVALVLLGALLGAVERCPYRRPSTAAPSRLRVLASCSCGRPLGTTQVACSWLHDEPPAPGPALISPTIRISGEAR